MIEDFHKHGVYELAKAEKRALLTKRLVELTEHHRANCAAYANMLDTIGFDAQRVSSIEELPFIPVRLFKELELRSIPREQVFKTLTSSGTTGQAVSKIYLDMETSMLHQKVMLRILAEFLGKKRLPFLAIETPSVMKDRKQFSARGATLIGLSILAKDTTYALNDDMSLNLEAVQGFLEKYGGQPFLTFGMTFMVWQHFYQQLVERGVTLDMSNGWLMTSGGWKKLQNMSVSQEEFRARLSAVTNLKNYLDQYGMAEQSGANYETCECGHMHASIYSDVIFRDFRDLSVCPVGTPGIVQVVSALESSYPGHSLLTEDTGVLLGEDDCPCGRKGKYFRLLGRIKQAEVRGCSDTYAAAF